MLQQYVMGRRSHTYRRRIPTPGNKDRMWDQVLMAIGPN